MVGAMDLELMEHCGVVLDAGRPGAPDAQGASFGCALREGGTTFLFYSAAGDVDFRSATICLATARDGRHFEKLGEVLRRREDAFCGASAVTPAVLRMSGGWAMVLAGHSATNPRRRIGVATAEDLRGPWTVRGELLSSVRRWEGYDIDCGPGACTSQSLFYYSNMSRERRLPNRPGLRLADRLLQSAAGRIRGPSHAYDIRRRISVATLRPSRGGFEALRHNGNPLGHLNGPRGSWNESLFCPGFLEHGGRYHLFFAASTYSVGPPYRQYVGLASSGSPYFGKGTTLRRLIDGPEEKGRILLAVRQEIALDTPSPVVVGDELWLYYAVMDRADKVWKTALSRYALRLP